MAQPKVFAPEKFEALVAPISSDQPTGPDLREDEKLGGEFRAIRDARDAASSAEKRLWEFSHLGPDSADRPEKPKPAEWKKVLDLSVDVLSRRSKDMWVAAWMIEALARLHGFQGLYDGFRVARELCERYWDGLHPRPESADDEDHADEVLETLVKLDLLDDVKPAVNLITQLDQIPISEVKWNGRLLTSADLKEALALEESSDAEQKARRFDAGAVPLKDFQETVGRTSSGYFLGLIQDLQDCLAEFDLLHQAVRERCGNSRPPAADNIRVGLEALLERVASLAGTTIGASEEGEGTDDAAATGGSAARSGGTGVAVGQIASREDAFKALLKVAEYFRRSEPHSPVSYALEQAVRWGRMPLPELLKDLVPNNEVLAELFRRTGIVPPEVKSE